MLAEVGAWAAFLSGGALLWMALTFLGGAVLAGLKISNGYWLLLGAPVGLGVVGVASLLAGGLGLAWSLWIPLLVAGATIAAAFLVGRRLQPARDRFAPILTDFWWVVGGTIVFAGVQFGVVMVLMHWPNAVSIMGDAQFHLAGSELVLNSGNVNPLTALGRLYEPNLEESNHYYPVFWHALVALLAPLTGIPLAHNLWVFVVGFLVWPVSLGALALRLAPGKPWIGAVAPVLAISSLTFPMENLVGISLGPFSVGVVLLVPTILTSLLVERSGARWWFPTLVFVAAAFAAHPSTGVLVSIPVIVLALFQVVGRLRALPNRGLRIAAYTALPTLILVVAFLVTRTNVYQGYAAYQRPTTGLREGIVTLLARGIFYAPVSPGWVLTVLLAILGLCFLQRKQEGRFVLAVAAPFLFLYLASTLEEGFLRGITGVWWKDFSRLIVPNLALVIVSAAVGLVGLSAFLMKSIRGTDSESRGGGVSLLLAFGVASAGFLGPGASQMHTLAAHAYSLDPRFVTPLDEDAVIVLTSVDGEFADGCLVGPHASGVGFTPVYSDIESCMPMPRPYTEDQAYLEQHFREIRTDPRVCEIVTKNNVVGFLEKAPPDQATEQAQAGLYNVDTSEGFDLVAESDGVRLWKITACD
mgnify:CR=1 FL=1